MNYDPQYDEAWKSNFVPPASEIIRGEAPNLVLEVVSDFLGLPEEPGPSARVQLLAGVSRRGNPQILLVRPESLVEPDEYDCRELLWDPGELVHPEMSQAEFLAIFDASDFRGALEAWLREHPEPNWFSCPRQLPRNFVDRYQHSECYPARELLQQIDKSCSQFVSWGSDGRPVKRLAKVPVVWERGVGLQIGGQLIKPA